MPISLITAKVVLKYGTFYNPASSHYSNENKKNIECTHCAKQNLKVCIGFSDINLCMTCSETASNLNDSTNIQEDSQYITDAIPPEKNNGNNGNNNSIDDIYKSEETVPKDPKHYGSYNITSSNAELLTSFKNYLYDETQYNLCTPHIFCPRCHLKIYPYPNTLTVNQRYVDGCECNGSQARISVYRCIKCKLIPDKNLISIIDGHIHCTCIKTKITSC